MKTNSYVAIVLGTFLVSMSIGGCANVATLAQNASSGRMGCAPPDVTITNLEGGLTSKSWTATCKKISYFCSGVMNDPMTLSDVSCTKQ